MLDLLGRKSSPEAEVLRVGSQVGPFYQGGMGFTLDGKPSDPVPTGGTKVIGDSV